MTAGLLMAAVLTASGPAQTDTLSYVVLIQGNHAGESTVVLDAEGAHVTFAFNDRGRGPDLQATYQLDEQGRPRAVEIVGNDYLKSPVEERFGVEAGQYVWESQAESGTRAVGDGAFYLPFNNVFWESAQLATAALRAGGMIPLLPSGEATVEAITSLDVTGPGGSSRTVTLHRLSGLGFTPSFVWLDQDRRYFATASGWLSLVPAGWEDQLETLVAVQEDAQTEWFRSAAAEIVERPEVVAFTDVRVFSDGEVNEGQTVLVRDGRIEELGPGPSIEVPSGARVVDGEGRTLLPGLFDMHAHAQDIDGLLNISAGVTTIRDLANDTEPLLVRRDGWDDGSTLGPRVVLAGFMDGPGPFAGPTRVLVDTPEEVRAAIDDYAESGHVQIKMYSSILPELVPVIVEHAHARGLKVSGHIPSGMTAQQAVEAGFDEIQHTNMLMLNFLGDTLDTRTPVRFTEVGRRGPDLDLDSDSVQAFFQLLVDNGVVVDPTVTAFEGLFGGRPGEVSPDADPFADRLPPTVRRGYLGGGLPVDDPELDIRHQETIVAMREWVARLHEIGVPIVAGTDALAGFALHRELENYVLAGIPAPEVLTIATAGAARIAGMDAEVGRIEVVEAADLVLVQGRPDERIEDIRQTVLVLKDGQLVDPERVWERIGVRSWRAPAM